MVSRENLSLNLTEYINPVESTTCRLCLKKNDLKEFEDIFKSFGNTTVARYVTNFVKIPISREDCFSNVVCKQCLRQLKDIEDFRMKVHSCNVYLNQLYSVYVDLNLKEHNLSDDKVLDSNEEITIIKTEEDTKIDIAEHNYVKTELRTGSDEDFLENCNLDNVLAVIKPKRRRRKDPNLNFPCGKCGKNYKSKVGRDHHLKTHTQREYYKCDMCDKKFLTKYIFKKHTKVHLEGDPMESKCKECGKQFTSTYNLENHMETHGDIPKYQCDICGKRLSHPRSFRSHQQGHIFKMKETKCEICNKIIRSRFPNAIHNHMKKHSNNDERLCPKCGKTFKCKQGFQAHLKRHAGNLEFQCDLCPKKYSLRKSLTDHIAAAHSSVKPYSCEICGKQFAVKSGWYIHGKVHAKQNPFTCTICEKRFGYPSHLKGHMKVVHGIVEETSPD